MTHVDDLEDLLFSDSPIEWAAENLECLGHGHAARIYRHPTLPDCVIRLSDYPDGWFMYADRYLRLTEEGDEASPFQPIVRWIGEIDGIFFAISERLDVVEVDSPLAEQVELIQSAVSGDTDLWDEIELHTPGIKTFIDSLGKPVDLRESNFMRRGTQLVVNDPYSSIPFELEAILRAAYKVSAKRTQLFLK